MPTKTPKRPAKTVEELCQEVLSKQKIQDQKQELHNNYNKPVFHKFRSHKGEPYQEWIITKHAQKQIAQGRGTYEANEEEFVYSDYSDNGTGKEVKMNVPPAAVSTSGAIAKKVEELLQEEKIFKNNTKGGRGTKKPVKDSEDEEMEEDETPPKTKGKGKQPAQKTGASKQKPIAKQKPATKATTPAKAPTKTQTKQPKSSGFLSSGGGSSINTKSNNKRKSPDDEDSDDESDVPPAKKPTGGKKVALDTPGGGVKTPASKKPAVATPFKKPAAKAASAGVDPNAPKICGAWVKRSQKWCDLKAVNDTDFCGRHKNYKGSKRDDGGDGDTDDDNDAGSSKKTAGKEKGKGSSWQEDDR